MLHTIIAKKARQWCQSERCSMRGVLDYIRKRGALREPQIEAIETYLYLKIMGENKPLKDLFGEGFFCEELNLDELDINVPARKFLRSNRLAHSLFNYAHTAKLEEVKQAIIREQKKLNYKQIIRDMFYGVAYPDYLMSLPMGAGKTYLMAALIYLDLYLAEASPDDKDLAQNFLILIPNAQKSSIGPSLRTIDAFDPEWVLPADIAKRIKSNIKFVVLDESKSKKKSMRTENPNAVKVANALRSSFNHIFVVNAEKVILNRMNGQKNLFPAELANANELREYIGKLPRLAIFIDEVHHATDSDIKLRQVVNGWCDHRASQITVVLGFSGTPYLEEKDNVRVSETVGFRMGQISNTVYYYSLLEGVRHFLKQPIVRRALNLDRSEIIRRGVEEFRREYGDKVYPAAGIAKLAIYCPTIEVLEKEVYPLLTGELGLRESEVLRYHRGNKQYPAIAESDAAFRALDTPASPHRYILLVGIGREGWDCRSLTCVILSQEGDCKKNMVLQTCCRCLRQAGAGQATALIWLNEGNARLLESQLKQQQNTTIEEIEKPGELPAEKTPRHARVEHLQLQPGIDFYQLKMYYVWIEKEKSADTKSKLLDLGHNLSQMRNFFSITKTGLDDLGTGVREVIRTKGEEPAIFNHWLLQISLESFSTVDIAQLLKHRELLRGIYKAITYESEEDGTRLWNETYFLEQIRSRVRLCFHIRHTLWEKTETVPEQATLLRVEQLTPVKKSPALYPGAEEVKRILKLDKDYSTFEQELEDFKKAQQVLIRRGLSPDMLQAPEQRTAAVNNKDKTFHYLPYDFTPSNFEREFLASVLRLQTFDDKKLEVYYQGARRLTEFVINCYGKQNGGWKNLGRYTTDFLIIKRKKKKIHKAMLVETKGHGFKHQFAERKQYIENEFVCRNNAKFNYAKFDFLYLEDNVPMENNIQRIDDRLNLFFGEERNAD